MDSSVKPLLSVIIITYGHEKFLYQCLENVFKQVTSFPFEVIISNDNSPDNSDSLIKSFIKENTNNNVTVNYHCHAKNLGMTNNFIWTLSQAKGKYIAYCEGDDYWIDDHKLQKQVNFLEENPKYSLCCGAYKTNNGNYVNLGKNSENFEFDLQYHFKYWGAKMLTICFRNDNNLVNYLQKFSLARDIHLIYFLLKKGEGYYLNEILGVYNIHEGGAVSLKTKKELINIGYTVFREFHSITNDEVIRQKLINYCILLFKYDMRKVSAKLFLKNFKIKDFISLSKFILRG